MASQLHSYMINILKYILKVFSKLILWKYHPEIIAITGSVGKTSTKEAIGQILSKKFRVRRTSGNLNNEIGVPLTIIGLKESPERSLFGWICVFWKAFCLLLFRDKKYPDKLILEMGADHKGDIEYLINFVPIKIGILTKVSKVHIEFFKSINEILKEKKKIFSKIPESGYAVLNNDDSKIADLKNELKCKCITYGIKNDSDVRATDVQITRREDVIGMNFKIRYDGNVVPVFLPDSLGLAQVYAFLGGVAVALIYGMNLVEISIFGKNYLSPKGRTHSISGIKDSYIIDDTYNSNPDALKVAVDLLSDMETIIKGKKIIVLGDMLELGEESDELHLDVGRYISEKTNIDYVLTVGDYAKNIYNSAKDNGLKNCFHFSNQEELIQYLKSILETDSLVLVKGSQGARMENVVRAIMKSPGFASKLLVRQNKTWADSSI